VSQLREAAERARAGQFTAHKKYMRAAARANHELDETHYRLGIMQAELDRLVGVVLDFCRAADQMPLPLHDDSLQQ
jgi:hypothetical protein